MKFRPTEEEQNRALEKHVALGKKGFIWKYGIVRGGLPVFIFWSIWFYYFPPGDKNLPPLPFAVTICLCLIFSFGFGILIGWFLWNAFQKRYSRTHPPSNSK